MSTPASKAAKQLLMKAPALWASLEAVLNETAFKPTFTFSGPESYVDFLLAAPSDAAKMQLAAVRKALRKLEPAARPAAYEAAVALFVLSIWQWAQIKAAADARWFKVAEAPADLPEGAVNVYCAIVCHAMAGRQIVWNPAGGSPLPQHPDTHCIEIPPGTDRPRHWFERSVFAKAFAGYPEAARMADGDDALTDFQTRQLAQRLSDMALIEDRTVTLIVRNVRDDDMASLTASVVAESLETPLFFECSDAACEALTGVPYMDLIVQVKAFWNEVMANASAPAQHVSTPTKVPAMTPAPPAAPITVYGNYVAGSVHADAFGGGPQSLTQGSGSTARLGGPISPELLQVLQDLQASIAALPVAERTQLPVPLDTLRTAIERLPSGPEQRQHLQELVGKLAAFASPLDSVGKILAFAKNALDLLNA